MRTKTERYNSQSGKLVSFEKIFLVRRIVNYQSGLPEEVMERISSFTKRWYKLLSCVTWICKSC